MFIAYSFVMRYHEPPRRSAFSYLLPFIIIIGIGFGAFFGLRQYLFSSIILEPGSGSALARVSSIEGSSAFIVPWGLENRMKLGVGHALNKGDVVSTEKSTRIEVVLFDGSKLRLNEDTAMYFSRLEYAKPYHISLNVVRGEVYIDTEKISHNGSDFIVISPKMILQADDTAFFVDTFPTEKVRVLEGVLNVSVFHVTGERKEPLTSFVARSGEEVILDSATIDIFSTGGRYFPRRFDAADVSENESLLTSSSWRAFELKVPEENAEVSVSDESSGKGNEEVFEESNYGNVSIVLPNKNEVVGSSITITGYYDKDRIQKIFVNDKQALLKKSNEMWEALVTLSAGDKSIEVISEDNDGKKRLVEKRSIKVDAEPPRIPEIIDPVLDKNNRAEVYGESIVITGRAHSDIARITVTADTHPPYELRKYAPGDDLFYYKASKTIGNLHDGSNVYTIQYYDEYDNVSTSTITLLLLPKEYEGVGLFDGDVTVQIIEPAESPYRTKKSSIFIRGLIFEKIQNIFINDHSVSFDDGDSGFSFEASLQLGENPFVIGFESINGEKQTVGVVTVIRE